MSSAPGGTPGCGASAAWRPEEEEEEKTSSAQRPLHCWRPPVQSLGQVFASVSVGQGRIFLLQEGLFVPDGIGHGLFIVDVQLTPAGGKESNAWRLAFAVRRRRFGGPVDDSHQAQFDGNDPARQRVRGVGARVHQVQLGHHGQRPPACGLATVRPHGRK